MQCGTLNVACGRVCVYFLHFVCLHCDMVCVCVFVCVCGAFSNADIPEEIIDGEISPDLIEAVIDNREECKSPH